MKAKSGVLPNSKGWAAEIKWDGVRAQVHTSYNNGEATTQIFSISGRDITNNFPEIEPIAQSIKANTILDGELVAFESGKPSFSKLSSRFAVSNPSKQLVEQIPVIYVAFDLLQLGGNSLVNLPYIDRREALSSILVEGTTWKAPAHNAVDIEATYNLACEQKLEGIVVKKLNSVYQPGKRSQDWLKIKVRHRQEFIICGWHEGEESLIGKVGSLILGFYEDEELRYAGLVGTGFSDQQRSELLHHFENIKESPFKTQPELEKNPNWVRPIQVVEVEFGRWSDEGIIHHSSFKGSCVDKNPKKVIREFHN